MRGGAGASPDSRVRELERGGGRGGSSAASEADDGSGSDNDSQAKERRPLLEHTPVHGAVGALTSPQRVSIGMPQQQQPQQHSLHGNALSGRSLNSPPSAVAAASSMTPHPSSLRVHVPGGTPAAAFAGATSGHRRHSNGNGGSGLLLPTTFLALSSDDVAVPPPSATAGGALIGTGGLLAAAGLNTAGTPRDSPMTPSLQQQQHESHGGLLVPPPRRSWLERVLTSLLAPEPVVPSSRAASPVHRRPSLQLHEQDFRGPTPGAADAAAKGSQLEENPPLPEAPLSSAPARWVCSSVLLWCVWLLVALLLLVLGVAVFEYRMDAQVHAARLALLDVPVASPVTGRSTGAAVEGEASAAHPLDYDSLIALHERSVSGQKELNKRLVDLSDRESKIHYLTSELANRDVMLASYKVLVARLKALKAQHAQMERRMATEHAESVLRQQLGLPATGNGSPPPEGSAYRARLLSLIFGNQTTEESRHELGLGMTDLEHAEEIAKLVREEKEAQAAAARGGFLALASRAARGDATNNAELKLESVMRVSDEDEDGAAGGAGDENGGGDGEHGGGAGGDAGVKVLAPADKLVDSNKNEYILSKPGDAAAGGGKKTVDVRLVQDLGIVIVASALGGLLAAALHQPVLLGYLAGGSAIGPGGLRLIGQFIQIETLAAFGATFLLFALGVEFSVSKLRRVKHIALLGGLLQLVSITFVVSLVGVCFLSLRLSSSFFIGCVLSMSSTTVVVKSLMSTRQIATLGGQVMLGLLIAQDIFLSVILALLNLARVAPERLASESLWLGFRFALLAVIVLGCMYIWPVLLRLLDASKSADLFLLGLVALCVFLTVVSERVIRSAEVGAFLSGLLISSSPGANPELTHRCLRLFAPIRDMFGALFFSSIGMLIDPVFLVNNAATIAMLVVAIIVLKSILTSLIVRLFGYSASIALSAGLGLSQIGEFAFVLSATGLSVGLLARETYLLLLGTTAVSIVVTPAILKLSAAIIKYFKLDDKKSHAQGVQVD